MHIIKMPVSTKNITITLPRLDPSRSKRGHSAHRTGAGTHHDRRTNRLRTRSAQRQAALTQE
jgi:hypothetical protein